MCGMSIVVWDAHLTSVNVSRWSAHTVTFKSSLEARKSALARTKGLSVRLAPTNSSNSIAAVLISIPTTVFRRLASILRSYHNVSTNCKEQGHGKRGAHTLTSRPARRSKIVLTAASWLINVPANSCCLPFTGSLEDISPRQVHKWSLACKVAYETFKVTIEIWLNDRESALSGERHVGYWHEYVLRLVRLWMVFLDGNLSRDKARVCTCH